MGQRGRRPGPVLDRFWSKVEKSNGCWLWRGAADPRGYGFFWVNGKQIGAHRFSLSLKLGRLPLQACHSCDVPACVNPDHLFEGSQQDNMRDCVSKGRLDSRSGARAAKPKHISEIMVTRIFNLLADRLSIAAIARQLDISDFIVWSIARGHTHNKIITKLCCA